MDIKYSDSKSCLTIYFYGELDQAVAATVRDSLDAIINSHLTAKKVVFDFSALTFIDSTGIGLIIGRYKKLKSVNISAYIAGANPNVEKIIYLSGLYKIMPKY